jgi:aspartate/methionine/tyrosine aminotransferase
MEQMREAFEERRSIIVDGLNAIDGIRCRLPEGAFYAYPNVQGLLGREGGGKTLETDLDLAGYLLEEARCAVVPGTAFGSPGFVRMSYAASNEMIREGLERIGDAVSKLS